MRYVKNKNLKIVSTSFSGIKTIEKVYGESGECNICFDNEKDIVFVPCGHFCCCHYCYSQLKEKTCIMCREKINLVATLDQLQ